MTYLSVVGDLIPDFIVKLIQEAYSAAGEIHLR